MSDGSFVQPVVKEKKLRCPFLGGECSSDCRAFFVDGGISHCLRLFMIERKVAKLVTFGEEKREG